MQRETIIASVAALSVLWWAFRFHSKHKAAQAKAEEDARFRVWDDAYNKALKEGKGEYSAMLAAAQAVKAGQPLLKLWDNIYNKSVNSGMSQYRAGIKATATVRREAVSKNKK